MQLEGDTRDLTQTVDEAGSQRSGAIHD